MNQPDYVRFLRCFASFAGAVLYPSVTRRAASYELHPRWVSLQRSETNAAEAPATISGRFQRWDRPLGLDWRLHRECLRERRVDVPGGSAYPRAELLLRRRDAWTQMVACRAVNPSETTHCVRRCQNISERVKAIGHRRQRLIEMPFAGFRRGLGRSGPGGSGRGLARGSRPVPQGRAGGAGQGTRRQRPAD